MTNGANTDTDEPSQDEYAAANDRADYQLTVGLFRDLVAVRFQLLGLLPVVSGGILAVIDALDLEPEAVIGPVLVGLVVTWGLALYEIRNSQIHDNAVNRMRHLERVLQLSPSTPGTGPGGFFVERTTRQLFLAPPTSSPSAKRRDRKQPGRLPIRHDVGLAIVYGVVLASWAAVLAFNVVLVFDADADDAAWWAAIVTAVIVGVAGWRIVSAFSRMGRNVSIIYRLAPVAEGADGNWPTALCAWLVAARDRVGTSSGLTWSEQDYRKETDDDRWQLALALGVVTDRRVLRGILLRHRIEPGAVEPNDANDLVDASRRCILGLELADVDTRTEVLRARTIQRYGHAPWCSDDEVRYRTEWLDHLTGHQAEPRDAVGD